MCACDGLNNFALVVVLQQFFVNCSHTIRKEQGTKFPVLWLSFVSEYSEGDTPRMGLRVPFVYHLALLCKSWRKKKGGWTETKLLSCSLRNMCILLFFQYMLMSYLTHRLIACKAHLEDVNKTCAKQSHCRKCKRAGDSLLGVYHEYQYASIILNSYSSRTRRIWADNNQLGLRPRWLLSAHIRQVREE